MYSNGWEKGHLFIRLVFETKGRAKKMDWVFFEVVDFYRKSHFMTLFTRFIFGRISGISSILTENWTTWNALGNNLPPHFSSTFLYSNSDYYNSSIAHIIRIRSLVPSIKWTIFEINLNPNQCQTLLKTQTFIKFSNYTLKNHLVWSKWMGCIVWEHMSVEQN